jgi:hypothetical protein
MYTKDVIRQINLKARSGKVDVIVGNETSRTVTVAFYQVQFVIDRLILVLSGSI